jgi:DNA-binding MarR family transcriptional regulator
MTQHPTKLTRVNGDGRLRVLQALDGAGHVSQRQLADDVGLAASQVNRVIRGLVADGHLRVADDSVRPYAYRLTPTGEAHLRTLSYERYATAMDHVRRVQDRIRRRLARLREQGARRVAFYGAGELMDVAFPLARAAGLELVCVVDDDPMKQGRRTGGLTIAEPASLGHIAPDALVITTFRHADRIRQRLTSGIAASVPVVEL